MTQSSMQIGNVEAAAARTALNTALEALATLSTGATAPTATFANQLWYDTTAGVLKKRTPANDGWETLITALGLKAMAELAIATKAEAETGTATDKGMNPLRTAQAIAALAPAASGIGFHPQARWQAVTRTAGVSYTNDTDYVIAVAARGATLELLQADTTWLQLDNGVPNTQFSVVSGAQVGPGQTYRLTGVQWFGNAREFREPL